MAPSQRRNVAGTPEAHPRWRNRVAGPVEPRFWAKVLKTETCWLWMAGLRKKGYGAFFVNGRYESAHRFSYELANGPIPSGMHVRHLVCDEPRCVRPDHLALGTNKENMHDAIEKGRHSYPANFAKRWAKHPKNQTTQVNR